MTINLGKQIYISSLKKAIDKARVTGKLDLKILNLYRLIIDYIEFTEGKEVYNEINRNLKKMMSELKYKFPDIICNYKLIISNSNSNIRTINTAPRVSDNIIDLEGDFTYNFKIEDFTKDFEDDEFDSYDKVMIIIDSISIDNRLYYITNNTSGTNDTLTPLPVNNSLEIPYSDIGNLIFIEPMISSGTIDRVDNININETNYIIKFRVSDNYRPNPLYSSMHTITIINSEYVENYPATIGDITINVENRAITIMTLSMFTTQMRPPYSDPENDLIDAIRIDRISNSNSGIFYFNNNPIQPGDIITRQDLIDGLFKHEGVDSNSLSGDSIEFSARDEGSKQWVQ